MTDTNPTLPPFPDWSLKDDLGGFVPSEVRTGLRLYGLACYEAGLRARQAPAAGEVSRLVEKVKQLLKTRLHWSTYTEASRLIDLVATTASTPEVIRSASGGAVEWKALEFAEYLARDGERLLDAINAEAAARMRIEEDYDADRDSELAAMQVDADAAGESLSEAMCGLQSGIYEFRKRRDKIAATPATPPQAVAEASASAVPDGPRLKAWSCQSGADYLAGKTDVGRCENWCGDKTKCTTSTVELPPASSMFRRSSLAHESNGGSDYCYHCGIDMCSQGGVNGQCPSLKRQYDTLVKEGKIAPFPDTHPLTQQAPAAEPLTDTQVLMEHSGCGRGVQVDQLTVRLHPGDKVVLVKACAGGAHV